MAKERIIQTQEQAAAFNELNKAGAQFVDIIQDMKNELQKVTEQIAAGKAEMDQMTQNTDKAERLARKLATADADMLASKSKRKSFDQALTAALDEQKSLADEINKLTKDETKEGKRLLKTKQDQLQMSKELTAEAQKFAKEVRKTERAASVFGGLAEIFGDVPVLGKVFDGFAKASKTMAEYQAKGHSAAKGMGAALGDIAKLGLATMFGMMIEGIKKLQAGAAELRRTLAMAGNDAAKAFSRAASAANSMGMSISEASGGIAGFNKALKSSAVVSQETSKYVLGISTRMGLGADAAAGLFKHAAMSGKSLKEISDETLGFTANFNRANGVFLSGATILEDVATASAATALSTKKFPGGLKKAAAEARKLGTDLAKSEAAMSGMLDFESSLTAEMEAEVLLGRELNLDKARIAALNGDIAGFNREIAKQGITAASFGKMNVLQQQAVAEAMGMQRDEFAERLKGEQAQKSLAEEAVKNGQKQAKEGKTNAELGADLAQQTMFSATAAERLDAAFERIQMKLATIGLKLLEEILPYIEAFSNWVTSSDTATTSILATMGKIAVSSILAPFKAAYGMVTSIVSGLRKAFGLADDVTKSASNAASTVAGSTSTAASSTASAAKGGGGGFFGGVKSFFGGIAEKVSTKASNFVEGAKNLYKDPVGQLKKLLPKGGKAIFKMLKRIPVVGTAIEGILATMDINRMIAEGSNKDDLYQQIGKRTLQGVGGVIGGAGAAAITTALSATGIPTFLLNALAYAGGDFLGRTLFGYIADTFGAKSLGKGVASVFGLNEKIDNAIANNKAMDSEISVEDFVIKPLNKDTITMAGGTKLGGNVEELLQELIAVVREGATVNFDSRAVGEALVLGAAKY